MLIDSFLPGLFVKGMFINTIRDLVCNEMRKQKNKGGKNQKEAEKMQTADEWGDGSESMKWTI